MKAAWVTGAALIFPLYRLAPAVAETAVPLPRQVTVRTIEGLHRFQLASEDHEMSTPKQRLGAMRLRGRAVSGRRDAAVDSNTGFVRVLFQGKRSGRLYEALLNRNGVAQAHRAPHIGISGNSKLTCRSANLAPAKGHRQVREDPPVVYPPRELGLAIEVDPSYIAGALSPAVALRDVRAVINAAKVLYLNQIGLVLNIFDLQVPSESRVTQSSDAIDLILDFQRSEQGAALLKPADLKHLITGHSLEDNVVGIGFVSGACSNQQENYSLSTRLRPQLHSAVLAHEIGHNLGAHHPEEIMFPPPPPSLMSGNITLAPERFSEFSQQEIASFVEGHPACFSEPPPLPELSIDGSHIIISDRRAFDCPYRLFGAESAAQLRGSFRKANLIAEGILVGGESRIDRNIVPSPKMRVQVLCSWGRRASKIAALR